MSEQAIYSIAAACFGFVSALFFGIGSAFLSQSKTVAMSGTYYSFNIALAEALVSQSAQYAIGALLLVVSFVLQVLAVPASQATHQWRCPVFASAWLLIPTFLFAIGVPAFFLCKWLTKWRLAKVIQQIKKEVGE